MCIYVSMEINEAWTLRRVVKNTGLNTTDTGYWGNKTFSVLISGLIFRRGSTVISLLFKWLESMGCDRVDPSVKGKFEAVC